MIIIAGDIHGEFQYLNKLINKKQPTMILQVGDFGYWPKLHRKSYVGSTGRVKFFDQYKIKNNSIPIYFCDGNHEDHESLRGLTNNEIMPNVFYMSRGSTLQLPDERTVLFVGGAFSPDWRFRDVGKDWFPDEEVISETNLHKLPETKIDIVISHTAPEEFRVFLELPDNFQDPSRKSLSYVLEKYKPKLWYFGHFHLYKTGFFEGCKWTALSDPGSSSKWWTVLK